MAYEVGEEMLTGLVCEFEEFFGVNGRKGAGFGIRF